MHIRKLMSAGLAGIVLRGSAGTAAASTVVARFDTITDWSPIEVSIDGHASGLFAWAGPLSWTRTGGDYVGLGGPQASTPFTTFCVEITEDVEFGHAPYIYKVVSAERAPDPGGMGVGAGMGPDKARQLQELFSRHEGDVVDALRGAAFQLAVWEIVYDDDNLLEAGSFQAWDPDSAVAVQAQAWLNNLQVGGDLPLLVGLSAAGAQDQVFAIADPPLQVTAISLPAATWSGGFLLVVLASARMRRRRGAAE